MAAPFTSGTITTGSISNLLAPGLRKVDFPTLKLIEQQAVYPIYSNMETSTRNYETDQLMSGFGALGIKGEGQPMNVDVIAQHGQKTYTWKAIAGAFGITFEASEDDLYNVVKGQNPAKLRKLHLMAMHYTKEVDAAGVWNNATATTGTGAGLAPNINGTTEALLSTAHTLARGGTMANTPSSSTAFSLQMVENATTHFLTLQGEEGFYVTSSYSYCIVHPNSWPMVEKVFGSELEPFTNDNQVNAIHARVSKTRNMVFIYDPYLTSTTGSIYLAPKGTHYVNFFDRNKLVTHNWDDPSSMVGYFGEYSRYGVGVTGWPGVYGSLP